MHSVQVPAIIIGVVVGTIIYALLMWIFARKHFSWLNVAFWAAWMAVWTFSFEYFKINDFISALIGAK